MRVGISGHQRLEPDSSWDWVQATLRGILEQQQGRLTGISSLAVGADQLFAELALEVGGRLHVVIPFDGYHRTFKTEDDLRHFQRLLTRAETIETLGGIGSDEDRFLAAGIRVADLSETMVVVWDAKPAKGLGGTADVVQYAQTRGLPIVHVNPVARTVTRL
jgi:hypothetical protein